MRFEPGFVVQLKSGSPAMTVVAVEAEGVRCVYYSETNDEVRAAVIPAVALDLVEIPADNEDDEGDEDEEEGD